MESLKMAASFCRNEQSDPKIHLKIQRDTDNTTFEAKNAVGGVTFPHFKLCDKFILIKIIRYWHKDKYVDQ